MGLFTRFSHGRRHRSAALTQASAPVRPRRHIRLSRKFSRIGLPLTAVVALSGLGIVQATTAHAADTLQCVDGNSNPNNTDVCWAFAGYWDYQVAEVTQAEPDCDQFHYTYAKIRVRIYGNYTSATGKYNISSFSIRYLSGYNPWLYVRIGVEDGNGQSVDRAWNNYGNWITTDGAGRGVDNTINRSVPGGYAPVFGRNGAIIFTIYGKESAVNAFGDPRGGCHPGPFYVMMRHY
jgi:hypothetical protein